MQDEGRRSEQAARPGAESAHGGVATHAPFSDLAQLNALLAAAVAAVITIDTRGIIRYANASVERMFGYAPHELVGRNVSVLMHAETARDHDGHIARHVRTGEARIIGIGRNVRGRRKDGTSVPVHLSVGEIFAAGELRGYTGILTDQSALEATETRLSAAIDGLDEGFALFDRSRRLILCNDLHRRIYAIPEDLSRPGTMLPDHFVGARAAAVVGLCRTLASEDEGGRSAEESRHELSDGRILVTRRRWLGNGDTIITTRDVTAEVENEMTLQRAARLRSLGELTGGVAHDFNNLLAVIIGNLELLDAQTRDEAAAEMIGESLEAAEIGARLTARLLAFARRQPLTFEPTNVNALVLDTVALLKRTLGEGIELTLDLSAALPHVVVDPAQLESGLVNLATNARDAMPSGGRLVIETAIAELEGDEEGEVPRGTFVRLSVSDSGTGMTPHVRARAFEPFFTTKERGRGSGLGLSSIYGFARQIGGALTVDSEVGKGSTFHLYLPTTADTHAAAETAKAAEAALLLQGRTVLVVEDDARVRRTTVKRVEALGARVVEAADAREALDAAAKVERLDAVFTDVMMPGGIDGYELARRLATTRPEVAVLLTSGYADTPAAGAPPGLTLLRKPYRQNELRAAFEELLRG